MDTNTLDKQQFINLEDSIEQLEITPYKVVEPDEDEEQAPILHVKQIDMWERYISPKSPTYGNAQASALAAGYKLSSARIITNTDYFKKKLRRMNMLSRAEKVLKKTLIMETKDDKGREQADLLRIQVDAAKHITKTLGKDEGYSERSEVTGKDGSPIVFLPTELMDKYALTPGEATPTQEIITNQEQ